MKSFRYSPILNEDELLQAIKYTHYACFELTKKVFGRYLPVSGNLGIFSHFENEFLFLTGLREKLTQKDVNWNQKYYKLYEPIVIPSKGEAPETTYTYLYIRKPDDEKPQVGDIDLVLEKDIFNELKNTVSDKKEINSIELLYRPDLNMIRLATPDTDALTYITTKYMYENVET